MQKQILPVIALLALLIGCGGKEAEIAASGAVSASAGSPKPSEMPVGVPPLVQGKSLATHDLALGESVYKSTCGLCHRIGSRGAPRLGDKEDWESRLARGKEVLYDRAINGYRGSKGSMPSRGSNARLSENEVKAAVDYMVWYSVPWPHDPLRSHMFSATTKQSTIS